MIDELILNSEKGRLWPAPSAGCVLYLPGHPPLGSTIRDYSGNDNHGTITGPTWTRLPSGLWGLSFDGSDDLVTIPAGGASLDFTSSDFTFLAWLNLDDWTNPHHLYSKGLINSDGLRIVFDNDARIYIITYQSGANQVTKTDANPFTAGTWVFAAITRSGADCRIYVNTVQKATVLGSHVNPASAEARDAQIGAYNSGSLWKGGINLFRAFSSLLSTAEMDRTFQQERHLFGV